MPYDTFRMPPAITPATVRRIAQLSRLALAKPEITASARELANILKHFSAIQSLDTAHVEPAADVTGQHNITRADTAQAGVWCSAADLLAQAPLQEKGHIKVPAVF